MAVISYFPATAGGVEDRDISFIDLDGTVLFSYSLAEIQDLEELPPLPSRDGYICQGWNWDLADIKALHTQLDVGATYATADGLCHLRIGLVTSLTVTLRSSYPNGSVVNINWGDGTQESVTTSTTLVHNHTYGNWGEYEITISTTAGICPMLDASGTTYTNLYKIALGAGYRITYSPPINSVVTLEEVALPVGSVGMDHWLTYQHRDSRCPAFIVPKGCSRIMAAQIGVRNSLPLSVIAQKSNAMNAINTRAKSACVNNGGNIKEAYGLQKVCLTDAQYYNSSYSLFGKLLVDVLYFGEGMGKIGLRYTTNLTLKKAYLPSTANDIDGFGVNKAISLREVHCKAVTPPALVNAPEDGKVTVYVPAGSVNAYRSATNWSVCNILPETEVW